MTVRRGLDVTKMMVLFSAQKVVELEACALSCYVFQKDSPSYGMERVQVFNRHGMPGRGGVGMFARIHAAYLWSSRSRW